jgi:hypothetical protein
MPEIGIEKVDASPLNLERKDQTSVSIINGQWPAHLHQEVGRLHLGKGDLEVLNDLDATSLVEANGLDSRGIRHGFTEPV